MVTPVKRIVVVGGGSAGWITAGLIAARYVSGEHSPVSVTLIESPNISIIGVGEGTWPTMVNTLKKLGITETEFLKKCDASFKQASKFRRWVTGADDDHYYHPFSMPQSFEQVNLAPQWQRQHSDIPFAHAVGIQAELCDRKLAPKQVESPDYSMVENHGYHLDAGKFAKLLMEHCTVKLGVKHVLADVVNVNSSANGDIASLTTEPYGELAGDLFIDCSGTASLLIGQHYAVPFVSKKDILFIDKALAVQVPYPSANSDIESATLSTAQTAGWIWDIGLPTRRGVGHVFSSGHITLEQAKQQLREYLRDDVDDVDSLTFRELDINPGHREKFWVNNCVAVGMSSGFLEPLEASALVMVEMAANTICAHLPATRETMDIVAEKYNENFVFRWERVIDFLKLHYVLSKRDDSAFWIDNRKEDSIPESLKKLLHLWRYQSPSKNGFLSPYDLFPAASYQYILYGMGYETQPCHLDSSPSMAREAEMQLQKVRERKNKVPDLLPSNRAILNAIAGIELDGELDLKVTQSSSWVPVPIVNVSTMAKTHPLFFKEHLPTKEFTCVALLGLAKDERLLATSNVQESTAHVNSAPETSSVQQDNPVKLLQAMELLEPVKLDITFNDKSAIVIKGLHVLNRNKLSMLSAEQLSQLQQHQVGALINDMQGSLRHMPTLIEKKNQQLMS